MKKEVKSETDQHSCTLDDPFRIAVLKGNKQMIEMLFQYILKLPPHLRECFSDNIQPLAESHPGI